MVDQQFIPFHRPSIGEEEIRSVERVLSSGWLTTGPVTINFERQFASFVGCKYALAVNSATAALRLAIDCLNLESEDEVLVPTFTFTATAAVVIHAGARPVLCDSAKGEFNVSVHELERRLTSRTKAIIPVHMAGQPCDLDGIRTLGARHGIPVIEDAAHALPASYKGKRIGSISEFTAFSFYATKTLSTGEGGMLTTENEEYAHRVMQMRLHGISGDAWKRYSREGAWFYEVQQAGFKMNMCDVLAGIGCAQLEKCERLGARRQTIAKFYDEHFSSLEALELPPAGDEDSEHAWHLYILRIRPELMRIGRNQFIEELRRRGIGTSVHFIPLHLHPFYAKNYGYNPGDFPNAENAYTRCISLPIFPAMSDSEVERVVNAVTEIVNQHSLRSIAVV